MLLLALAAWLYGSSRLSGVRARRVATVVTLLLALLGTTLALDSRKPVGNPDQAAHHPDQLDSLPEPYTPARLDALLEAGKPVFVNLTAAWCITCLVNERVALNRPEVQAHLRQAGIVYLKGDWTNQNAEISALLAQHGRSGVPLYLYYPHGKFAPAQVLPQLLTPAIVLGALL
jgi:thiol:disulfide interchange protein DsbD